MDPGEGRGLETRNSGGPFLSDSDASQTPLPEKGKGPAACWYECACWKKTKQNPTTFCDAAQGCWGPLLNLSEERNQGCLEIETVAEKCKQAAHNTATGWVLSHSGTRGAQSRAA